jgi:hypothetical protein
MTAGSTQRSPLADPFAAIALIQLARVNRGRQQPDEFEHSGR